MKKTILPTCGLVLTLFAMLSGFSVIAEDPMPSASSVGTECAGGGGPGGIGGSSQPADCITINCDGMRSDVPTGNTSAGTPIQPGTAEATNTVICVGEDPDIHEVTPGKDTDKIEVNVFCDGVLDQTVNKKVSDSVTFVVDPTNDYSTPGVVQAKFKWVDGGTPYDDGDKSGTLAITVVGVDKVQYKDTTGTFVDGPGTVCFGTDVELRAIPDPAAATFPTGSPVWTVDSKPTSAAVTDGDLTDGSADVTVAAAKLDKAGDYTFKAQCGTSSASITITVVKVEFNKSPVEVGMGPNRTSETPVYPATTPATFPYRVTATITPAAGAGSVTFDTTDAAKATVGEVSRTTVGDTVEAILEVTGLVATPAAGWDVEVRALLDGVPSCATTGVTVIKPMTRTNSVGAATTLTNSAVVIGSNTHVTSRVKKLVTITIKDQFGQNLHAIYDGENVVTEEFPPATVTVTGGATVPAGEVNIVIPDNILSGGIKLDEIAFLRTIALVGTVLTPAQITDWENKTLIVNGGNTAWAAGSQPPPTLDAVQVLKVDGCPITPDYRREMQGSNNNFPPPPLTATDTAL